MTYASATADDDTFCDPFRSSWRSSLRRLVGVSAVVLSALTGATLLPSYLADPAPEPPPAATSARLVEAPALAPLPGQAAPPDQIVAVVYSPLIDAGFSFGSPPVALSRSAPLSAAFVANAPAAPLQAERTAAASLPAAISPAVPAPAAAVASLPQAFPPRTAPPAEEVASLPLPAAAPALRLIEPTPLPGPAPAVIADVPVPAPRPSEIGARPNPAPIRLPTRRFAQQAQPIEPAAPAPDNRSFIEKLFGIQRPAGPVLAYAAPEDSEIGPAIGATPHSSLGYDRFTAVYDIAAHTVYMPDGARLEAHSGLGSRLDDPRHVNERNVGPTPPNVYELTPREALFHGVRALRLTPVGGGSVYGRSGLLAHTYMLGPNGDSNGCVSFKNYNAFLQAYLNGQVRRLVVVPHMS